MSKDVDKKDTSRLDKVIWTNLGSKSAREMAEEAGVSNEEVLIRKRELLDEIDVLTIDEMRAVLVAKANEIMNDAIKRSKNVQDERNYAPMLTASTGALKIVLQQLKDFEKADRTDIDRLNMARVRELLRLADRVMLRSTKYFAEHPGMTEEEMNEYVQTLLVEEASAMEMEAAK